MKKSVLVAVVSAFILSACGPSAQDAKTAQAVKKTDSSKPQVSVVDSKIVVDPDPLQFAKDQQNVKITWELPKDSKYIFPNDGITIKDPGDEILDCQVEPNEKGLKYSCKNKHSKAGKYKYTIKVDGSPAVPPLDPVIVND